jgi:hypothetical protein
MSDTGENGQRCAAVRKRDGQACGALALKGSAYCMAHDPRSSEWRVLGGKASSNANRALKLLPARLVPIFERLLRVFEQLDAGTYDRQVATAMATVAGTLMRIVQAGELEERMRTIEARLGPTTGRPSAGPGNASGRQDTWPPSA